MKITRVMGREIYDARGWPTVQCEIMLDNTIPIVSSVPAGLSRGKYEARELRDGGKRLWGLGVLKAIENIEQIIAPLLIDKEPQALEMDYKLLELDDTDDKSNLGANTLLAVSMALYRAQAYAENIELFELIAYLCNNETVSLPFPFFNVINGGLYAANSLQIQEFMIVPVGALNFRESAELGIAAFHELKNMLQKKAAHIAWGEEGGFAPDQMEDEEALEILTELLEKLEATYGNKCVLAVDIAASRFYDPLSKKYTFQGKNYTTMELVGWYLELVSNYPIFSLEDPFHEDDILGWQLLTQELGSQLQIAGDELFASQSKRIEFGIENNLATAAVIKPNQIGTFTQTNM